MPENGASLSKEVELTLFTIASYVGETLIENRVGSYWQLDEKNPDNFFELTIIRQGGSIIWPFQKVWKRFFNGPEDSLYAYGFLITEDYYEKRKLQLEEKKLRIRWLKKSGGSFKDLTNCPSLDVRLQIPASCVKVYDDHPNLMSHFATSSSSYGHFIFAAFKLQLLLLNIKHDSYRIFNSSRYCSYLRINRSISCRL